jgi:hypothetical protein
MRVAVIDGQGGGIGATIIQGLRKEVGNDLEVWALGTNSIATSRMMKSGANKGATGENAIVQSVKKADVITGPLAIIMPNAMMGEVTSAMADAVCSCDGDKFLIPLTQEKVSLMGVSREPLPHLVEEAVEKIKNLNIR